ncbi:Predicted component of virus defense system, contains PD-(D/E)xK nuclease domain, DUF524 [Chitinophaga rupis]|uniref:Predicted component of virus defense system, contains PD-(D/E)xK nuclease domain, DUF524 n=1 Tax=Chitinophaga rupis TaxID=573321 RepID=A0A1H7JCB1_9BACT|nr:DUF2357 domain-containing protein [Chitinophaga rupis]SEK72248.1 Predicted component of virus defense system, contains PD-(D/E)xK nuclease domain, DUF524 [Chitinophaga rupis]
MNNAGVYKLDADWGSLEIEVFEPKFDFYKPARDLKIHFSAKALGKTEVEFEPFYLFEWQKVQYSYVIEEDSSFMAPFELRINNRSINRSKKRGAQHLLAGQFYFENEVGETKIELADAGNNLIFELETEVFPQKMDYRSDYKAIMTDISDIVHNLAYDYLKDTFRKSRARVKGQATENEWWNILDELFEQLVISLEVIRRHPKHGIEKNERILPVEKTRIASKKNVDWLIKNGKYANESKQGINIFPDRSYTHVLSSTKHITYNTYENRFVVWAIRGIIERLRKHIRYTETVPASRKYSTLINKMKKNLGRLQGILHMSPFNEVGKFEERTHFSTLLTRGIGYRDFMHIYLLLARGLDLDDSDIFKIEPKNINVLYEYWCFLKLVQILKEQTDTEIDYQDLIRIRANKYSVSLEKGSESRVIFKKKDTGETTSVYFNKYFTADQKRIFTFDQNPDYSIEFTKRNYEKSFWYLFDAKYRIEKRTDKGKVSFNAPQDSIGQLHRYRDAILHTEPNSNTPYRNAIKNLGGIILYPFPLAEKEFESNDYYKSIDTVNIGALPFLPGKATLVSDFLNRLINKRSPEDHFEQFIGMDDAEYVHSKSIWKEWITIGVIQKTNQRERLRFLKEKLIYHIPFKSGSNIKLLSSKQILVCKAGTKEAFLYKIEKWNVLTEKELKKLGTTWDHRAGKYFVFYLNCGEQLEIHNKISPINFRYTTSEGLKRYLKDPGSDSGCFYLTNADSARLYEELKKQEIKFKLKWVRNENDPSLVEFGVRNLKILSSDTFPDLHFKLGDSMQSLNNLLLILNKENIN